MSVVTTRNCPSGLLNVGLSELQSRPVFFGNRESSQDFLGLTSSSLVTTLTELSRHLSVCLSVQLSLISSSLLRHVSLYLTHKFRHTPFQMVLLFTFQVIVYCIPLYFYPRLSLAPNTALLSWLKEMVIVKWVTPGTQISRHVTGGGDLVCVSDTVQTAQGNRCWQHCSIPPYYFPICNSNLSSYRGLQAASFSCPQET